MAKKPETFVSDAELRQCVVDLENTVGALEATVAYLANRMGITSNQVEAHLTSLIAESES